MGVSEPDAHEPDFAEREFTAMTDCDPVHTARLPC
jgi:hypothetical protein